MKRAAIYARFSSDLQNDRSIADQIALCCDYAEKQGYAVARVYEDAGKSGASIHGRAGIQQLVADAPARGFAVVLVESMSRLGRDQEDRAFIRKRLAFADVAIETPAEGVVNRIVDGVRAVLDSEALEDLKKHTRRGMRGRVLEGKSAGGLTYGYAPGASKGTRVIVDAEAAIVRRIFDEYVAGRSPRNIAERLNLAGVKPPRGRAWLASTINGNPIRGSGILGNQLYAGRLVWNRVTMRKDPDTGRRVSRANPQAEWIVREVPELRLVDSKIFEQATALKAERGKSNPVYARRPKHLLAGLLRCGCCGSSMVANNIGHAGRRIYCGRRKEGGICEHAKTYALADIERRVVEGLKVQLADPRAIERYLKTYREERKRLAGATASKRAAAEKDLAQAKREISRLVNAIALGSISAEDAKGLMDPLKVRREIREAELEAIAAEPNVVALHPQTVEIYLAKVNVLAATLSARVVEGGEDVSQALRDLVVSVVVKPGECGPALEVTGRLAELTGQPLPPHGSLRTVVAGSRYRRNQRPEMAVFRYAA